ncbi:extracellular solute-binding protein [Scrofimicrobium sp. R131]|uniref:Extracellular solute-binding protein n=1 Tax=Scrofimicrobium appendicitidis TaxID=3079930 RepID=A0AAU7V7U7_9ACTO
MRKSAWFAVAAAAALGLAGCSSGGTDEAPSADDSAQSAPSASESTDSITVWVDETRQGPVSEAAKKFTEETGTKVDLVLKNFDDIRADFTAQVPTGEGPDITVGANDWVGEFTANGVVAPVELGDKAGDFQESAIQAFTYNGQVYAVPYAIENIALIRNTDLAPEAPATWDDMMAAADAAGAKYKFLIQMNGEEGDPYTFYPLQTSFGSTVFKQSDDGSYTPDLNLAEGGAEYAQFLADNGPKGTDVFNQDRTYDIVVDAFSKGESPFLIGGPWMLDAINQGGINVAIDPVPSAGGQEARPFAGVQGFYLSAKAQNPLLATNFLTNYMATEDAQYALYEAGGRPPALKAAADKAAQDPITAGFMKAGENALPMPSIPEMASVWTPWGRTEAAIISGAEADPAAAWERMIGDIQKAIDGN